MQIKEKPRVTGLCEGNPPVTIEFPSYRASNAENASIWWRHHGLIELAYMQGTILGSNLYAECILAQASPLYNDISKSTSRKASL